MYKFFLKYNIKLAVWAGSIITAIFFFIVFINLDDNLLKYKDRLDEINYFNFGLISMILLLSIAVLLLMVFGVKNIFENWKKQKKGLLVSSVCLLLFLIIFLISKPDVNSVNAEFYQKFNISTLVYKYINAGIWMMVALFIGAILTVIVMETKSIMK